MATETVRPSTDDLNTALAPVAECFKQLQAESERVPFAEIKAYLRAIGCDVLERTKKRSASGSATRRSTGKNSRSRTIGRKEGPI